MSTPKLVLVIDPYEGNENLLRDSLRGVENIEVVACPDPFGAFFELATKAISIVIMEIKSPPDHSSEKGIQLYMLIKKLFPKVRVLFHTDAHLKDIETKLNKIDPSFSKRNFFSKGATKDGLAALKDKISTEIEYLTQSQIWINDKWIFEKLDDKEIFKSLGIKEIERFDNEIKNTFIKYENHQYSFWFSEVTYKSIFDKKIYPVLEFAGLKEIADTLKSFLSLESMAYIASFYSSSKRYRDHFLHQVRIAVLGDFLLSTTVKIGKKNCKLVEKIADLLQRRQFPQKFRCDFDERSIRNTWWITALTHDCAYALESLFSPHLFEKNSLETLKEMFCGELYEQYKENHENAERIMRDKIGIEILNMTKEVELESFREVILAAIKTKKMHSIYSAYNFWKKYQHLRNKNFCYELVIQSILLHHNFCDNDNEPRITFEDYPLAFLLILVDEIQEWGRPTIIRDNGFNPISISQEIELEEILVKGVIENPVKNGQYKYALDSKGIVFTFDYKKVNQKNDFSPVKKYNSKKKNLERLLNRSGILPTINLEFQFKDWIPEPITIQGRY
jgi:hypothetical protein